MYGFLLAQSLSNMAIGIFTLRQQLRGLLSKNWTGTIPTPYVEYLVVGGGGAGGHNYCGGGGGAGGLLTGILPVISNVSYTVTIGGGGAPTSTNGSNGANSVLSSIIASGGGGGGGDNGGFTATVNGIAGGSGGGGTMLTANLQPTKGAGIAGQGNSSGTASANGFGLGASGGGAGTVGLDSYGSSNPAPVTGGGGAGIASAISGSVVVYAGGGGGGNNNSTVTNIPGGVGGGGAGGANSGTTAGTPGQQYTGGGGGGGGSSSGGGAGGSGIVIISYPDNYAALTTTTGSPTVSTSGSGSLSFNGSSQYVTTPTSSSFEFATSTFTLEYWMYPTSLASTPEPVITGTGSGSTSYDAAFGYINANGSFVTYLSSTGSSWDIASGVTIGSTGSVSANNWYHVAIVRNGNTWYTFLNGVQGATFTNASSLYQSSNTLSIASTKNGNFAGYMSNIRFVKGTALYTANFTPSTAPLTVVTNTQLLLNTVSGAPFADASTNSFAPTATGSPTWNQSSPFATGLGYKNRVYTWTSTGTWAVTV